MRCISSAWSKWNIYIVSRLFSSFTSEEVLTLDWVEGISIREKEILKSKKINIENIATDIIQHFLRHAVRDGFFHADMHQGNLLIDSSGQIITIDFGIMGRLDKLNRKFLAEILYGFIMRDYKKVANGVYSVILKEKILDKRNIIICHISISYVFFC